MTATDAQVRKLMEEIQRHGNLSKAALRAGLHRETARKYRDQGLLPSQARKAREYRTRKDPFDQDWDELESMLRQAPELEAKTLFEYLSEQHPERYQEGQLRTLQRRLRRWRAQEGPPKEVFFSQEHRPGERLQTDFTHGNELKITVGGEPFSHLLCHVVLPYSNWQSVTVCRSESLAALKRGLQRALTQLGRITKIHQTDNSTAATHNLSEGKRTFNESYLALMRHFGLEPRTIALGQKHQNGDVESLNGVLKRRLEQYLLLRGHRDFETAAGYEGWIDESLCKSNARRQTKLERELAVMAPLRVALLPEYRELEARVSRGSTLAILYNTYSVPARLIGEVVRVHVYEDRLEIFHQGRAQLCVERLLGRHRHRINYRHVIASLLRKPQAFARYRFREELFPSLLFRKSYDLLCKALSEREAELSYLRLLHLAATTNEDEVETALELLLEAGEPPRSERVKELVVPKSSSVPELQVPQVDLQSYDALLDDDREVA